MGQSGKELMTINMNVNLFQFILSMSINAHVVNSVDKNHMKIENYAAVHHKFAFRV